jgi:outer membrane receptor protein involved in Fe transport
VYAWVRVSYRGAGVADADGARIADCVLTDLLVRKELLRKRAMISIGVENLFDREHQTFANAWDSDYWWYDGPLPGRGRTYSLRLEYRL